MEKDRARYEITKYPEHVDALGVLQTGKVPSMEHIVESLHELDGPSPNKRARTEPSPSPANILAPPSPPRPTLSRPPSTGINGTSVPSTSAQQIQQQLEPSQQLKPTTNGKVPAVPEPEEEIPTPTFATKPSIPRTMDHTAPLRDQRRAAIVSRFLQGKLSRTPAHILELWMQHPYGRPHKDSPEMFSFSAVRPYTSILPIRPALSSFAVQVVERELISQARAAVKPAAGLHVHIPTDKQPTKPGVPCVDWQNLGSHTHNTIAQIHQKHQPWLQRNWKAWVLSHETNGLWLVQCFLRFLYGSLGESCGSFNGN